MRCIGCGTVLDDTDRFCPRCGKPATEARQMYDAGLFDDQEEEYTDEEEAHLYRDSFLTQRRENRSHAFVITLLILLVIGLGVGVFLVIYFDLPKKLLGGEKAQDDIVIFDQNGEPDIFAAGESQPEIMIDETAYTRQTEKETAENTAQVTESESEIQAPETDASQIISVSEIENIMTGYSDASAYGVFIYDLKNQKEYAAGQALEPMYASGTIAVPIIYTAAVLLDQGRITLNDQITYVNSIGGRGEAYPERKDGKVYDLSYYLTTMLSYNDNNCMNCLIQYLGLDTINEVCSANGMSGTKLERALVTEVTDGKENYVSARDLTMMVKELYNGKFSVIGRDFMQKYFRIDEYDANRTLIGMADGPAEGAELFLNQNGRGDTRFAECALIGDESCTYVISIVCRGDYGFVYEDAVKAVSAYVWDAQHREKKTA